MTHYLSSFLLLTLLFFFIFFFSVFVCLWGSIGFSGVLTLLIFSADLIRPLLGLMKSSYITKRSVWSRLLSIVNVSRNYSLYLLIIFSILGPSVLSSTGNIFYILHRACSYFYMISSFSWIKGTNLSYFLVKIARTLLD